MTILEIEGVQIQLFGEESRETVPVFYLPVLEEDEGRMVWEGLDAPCVLACVKCGDWNRELSPWRADRLFVQGEDFGGGGEAFLALLTEALLPGVEERLSFQVTERGLAGYSLAGLFAVYAMYRTDCFQMIGSMSGSLWFDGFVEYAIGRQPASERISLYLSLGSREHRSKNPRMRSVRECTERLARHWGERFHVIMETNPGGHFDQPQMRMAKGIRKLLQA